MLVGSPVAPSDNETVPTQPRHLKRWLKALPLANPGETARLFCAALEQINARDLPPARRLELLELMRPTRRYLLDKLGRHFINRPLPLSPRGQRIAELNRRVLEDVAQGYLTAVEACRLDADALRPRHQVLAMHRALHALYQQLFHLARLYQPVPPGLWQRIHGIHALAGARGLETRTVKDPEMACGSRCTLTGIYKQACLLALADPLTLHRGDVERLARFLEERAGECTLGTTPIPDNGGHLYVVDLAADAPPAHRPREEAPQGETIRYLNPAPLLRRLRACTGAPSGPGHTVPLTSDQASRVIQAWTNTARRRFGRSPGQGEMEAAIGMDAIHRVLHGEDEGDGRPGDGPVRSREEALEALFTLAELSPPPQEQEEGISVSYLKDLPGEGSAGLWEQVARRRPMRDTEPEPPEPEPAPSPAGQITRWRIMDASAGGFRLRWNGDGLTRAQVGELLILRDRRDPKNTWRVGMIRRMIQGEDGALELGVKMLAPRALPVGVSAVTRHNGTGQPAPALLLPAIQVLGQPATLVCPTGLFQLGERVRVHMEGETREVLLPHAERQTTRFTQFRYRTAAPQESTAGRPSPRDEDRWPDLL
ncbi:hypothetical protein [Ectothiorhodospira mobilis]|uniref:hypothetical protein n=1 Tax=Ectothiorhodospira mobilis TaxID=195064 RepID=UPI001EE7F9B0|nr:hypothetical protein [Ectothiorhodospira mobilis]MCG5535463.1 hypothetical protein [Ectothiorhodospira mobilis]